MFAAVLRVLNPAEVPIATVALPTSVCPVPAAIVTAPELVPVLMIPQSKQPSTGSAGAVTLLPRLRYQTDC